MKKILKAIPALPLLFVLAGNTAGQEIMVSQTTRSGIYRSGELITMKAFTRPFIGDTLTIRVVKNNHSELEKRVFVATGDSVVLFRGSFSEPCTVMAEVHTAKAAAALGAAVDPLGIRPGGQIPPDFDRFWKARKKKVEEYSEGIRCQPLSLAPADSAYSCCDAELSCPGPRPARGYFAKPANMKKGTLPAVLLVHAAGVKGSWCRSEPGNALAYARRGALCFDLNAHGMLNGQPDSYYEDLENGELKLYFLRGLGNPDSIYFGDMYYRLLRTISFLASQPEWDGRRLLVIGESQGGGQALAAAGLDRRVSHVVALVPAMCDWFGPLEDREGGWPQPLKTGVPISKMNSTLPYFDAASLLSRSKARIFVEIGLIDITCPPASVYAAVNQAKGEKQVLAVPYRQHHQPQNSMTKEWEDSVYLPRQRFISDFLK